MKMANISPSRESISRYKKRGKNQKPQAYNTDTMLKIRIDNYEKEVHTS